MRPRPSPPSPRQRLRPLGWAAPLLLLFQALPAALALEAAPSTTAAGSSRFERSRYTPAVLYLTVTKGKTASQEFIDLVLIPPAVMWSAGGWGSVSRTSAASCAPSTANWPAKTPSAMATLRLLPGCCNAF